MRHVGTRRLSWRRLAVMVDQVASDPTSNLHRQVAGPLAGWDLQAQLAAVTANAVRVLVWQQTEDGQSKRPKHQPEPIVPPSDEPADTKTGVTGAALVAFRARTRYAERE